jgi:hypothetical protein
MAAHGQEISVFMESAARLAGAAIQNFAWRLPGKARLMDYMVDALSMARCTPLVPTEG